MNNDEDDNKSVKGEASEGGKLGKLFFTVKYSCEESALHVTINKCTKLPAKNMTDNSRYLLFLFICLFI